MRCSFFSCWFRRVFLDEAPSSTLASITRLKSRLSDIVEPDFGLMDQLLSLGVLTRRDYDDIRSDRRGAWRRSAALLDLLTSENDCRLFLKALQRTHQQHVVNLITENGGQNNTAKLHRTCLSCCRRYNVRV